MAKEEELGVSKITRHNQVTLPEKVRSELKVKEGDYLGFVKVKETGEVMVKPAKIVYRK